MSKHLDLTFPLRPNFDAKVLVPRDITTAEAKRMVAFLETLAVPHGGEADVPKKESL